ncbi:FkbM family methyltransferase [Streptomyces himalayensis]|uniref:FkbM family methyltransferase n=1 Tax=Streptomyces himalayensis subsp. himalayensis TaxID=2756131 RepID=A0A7W0DIX6_9ACTN|nr:FkbM family methyltransferase [Streptomyces himalayensis]MBA2945189.1 FkbM family methyltransferase [Streptomyces himalayensis subsp. himalayensis]
MGATVPIAGGSMHFWCPPEWRGNAKMTYVWRDDYEVELAQLHRWVRPGDVVVDVGAHYGSYTLPLAQLVGAQGCVFAVEPAEHARAVLSRNIRMNHLRNVRLLPVAAGAESTRGNLHLHDDRSRASMQETWEQRTDVQQVEVVRLDDVVPSGHRISLIKMDIEGYEPQALRGATGILIRDRPIVIFELLSHHLGTAGSARAAWDLLVEHGYRMHRVTDEGALLPVESPEQRCGSSNNVVALHPDERHRIGTTAS